MRWQWILIFLLIVACGGGSKGGTTETVDPPRSETPTTETSITPSSEPNANEPAVGTIINPYDIIKSGCQPVRQSAITVNSPRVTDFSGSLQEISNQFYTNYHISVSGATSVEQLEDLAHVLEKYQLAQRIQKNHPYMDQALPIRFVEFVSRAEMNARASGRNAIGLYQFDDRLISIAPHTSRRNRQETIGHELGHAEQFYQGEGRPALRLYKADGELDDDAEQVYAENRGHELLALTEPIA